MSNLDKFDLRQILAEAQNTLRAKYGGEKPRIVPQGHIVVPADLLVGLLDTKMIFVPEEHEHLLYSDALNDKSLTIEEVRAAFKNLQLSRRTKGPKCWPDDMGEKLRCDQYCEDYHEVRKELEALKDSLVSKPSDSGSELTDDDTREAFIDKNSKLGGKDITNSTERAQGLTVYEDRNGVRYCSSCGMLINHSEHNAYCRSRKRPMAKVGAVDRVRPSNLCATNCTCCYCLPKS